MPSYKLIYFDARGRGETARMLFKLAGVDFEDKRVDYPSAEWDELKQSKCIYGFCCHFIVLTVIENRVRPTRNCCSDLVGLRLLHIDTGNAVYKFSFSFTFMLSNVGMHSGLR